MILKPVQLTETENKVIELLKQGHSNAYIALKLEVKEKTVKFHLTNIYRKTGVSGDREFLARFGGPATTEHVA